MNNSKLIITTYKDYNATLLFDNSEIKELFLSNKTTINVNDIIIGRVSNVKNDIKACFVDISNQHTGYLPFDNIYGPMLLNRSFDGILKQGDYICVQVIKDAIKTKNITLSMRITIPGTYSVVLSDDKNVHFSSKLNSIDIKKITENTNINNSFGYLIRTNAAKADYKSVEYEINFNCNVLHEIIDKMKTRSLYSCLYKARPSYIEQINNIPIDEYDEIITDSESVYELIKSNNNVRFYNDHQLPLNVIYSFDKAFDLATSKKVNLKCGGYIIIERTEALTVIDVNSGKYSKSKDKDILINQVNKDAALEIARQLRLRNISGIILIDFINYANKDSENELITFFKNLLKRDRVKTSFIDITPLGLIEVTREKKYASIYDILKND